MLVEIIIFLVTSLLVYYLYVYKKLHWYFERRGIRYSPGVPVFGNVLRSTFLKRHIIEDIDDVYRAFPDDKYVGYMEGTVPVVMIRNPDIIKAVTIKDFDHFVDHKNFFEEDTEPLFTNSLLMMKGEKWRHMRTTLSPAFTGSKMRLMVPFMMETSDNIVEYFKEHQSELVDVDDLMRRYTNDVIASAAFGLQVNSLTDKDNEFYKMGQSLFNFTFWQRLCLFGALQFPYLAKLFEIRIFPKKTEDFFINLVTSTMEYREKNNVERPDMIQLLIEATKGTLKHHNDHLDKHNIGFAAVDEVLKPTETDRKWTTKELASQVFIFFLAGFESSANALVMCVHELAINPKVQDTLYEEIREFNEREGKLTYENIAELKYLDCVLNETTRKWSAALVLDRICTKAYEIDPPRKGGKPYKVKPGDTVYNVVNSLHMDEKYFPNPEVFDPDRFSDENKHNIKPFSFIPFGTGPRNCIGSRFALLELKIMIFKLVLNFKIIKSEKTMDPIKLDPSQFSLKVAGGSWVRLEAR